VRRSPEFEFLADCCRWNFLAKRRAPLRIRDDLDPALFLRLARFHRVQGLVQRALIGEESALRSKVQQELASDSVSIAALNLTAAHECSRLLQSFNSSTIPLLFLKGLTLGALAYGTTAAKAAVDIDILVPEPSLEKSAALLRSIGYELVQPVSSEPGLLEQWHRLRKESLWAKPRTSIRLDLHSRLADNPRLLASMDTKSARQTVDVGNGIRLPTLADDELFAYLAVHGSSSAWFRLKWIADFAALLAPLEPAEIERRYRRALELGAGRAAAQALLLADELFASLAASEQLRAELRRDGAARLLCRAALNQVSGRREPVEPTRVAFGTATIHWSQLFLLAGARFKLSEVARQSRAALTSGN
jgi:hypothetical protein